MEWYHFSDFHIGRPKGPQSSALASLIDAVKIVCDEEASKVDAVFITGDIAYSGQPEEYNKFRDDFLLPLRSLPAFSNAVFFAIPGNHDVDSDISPAIAWDTIGKRFQEIFFSEDEDGFKARKSRSTVFDAYWNFVSNNEIISPNPAKEITLLHTHESLPFDVLATNTSFFSDREQESSGEITPSPIESLRQVLIKRVSQKPVVILAHHPITCLLNTQQGGFKTFLKEKKAVLLHGHEHRPSVTFGNDGTLRTLGFGASYMTSLQKASNPPYLNTFTHCRLDGKTLYLRAISWHFDPGVWTDSTASQLPDCMPENCLRNEPGQIKFPSLVVDTTIETSTVLLRTLPRATPKPTKLIPIDEFSDEMWERLSKVSSNLRTIFQKEEEPTLHLLNSDDGKPRFAYETADGQRHLLVLIWAVNHVLSSKEVETVNTQLDTEGYATATVISLGKISFDANAMYLRLQTRKKIEVLVNERLTAESDLLLSEKQRKVLANLDSAKHAVTLLLGSDDLYLLVVEDQEHVCRFYVVNGQGDRLAPTNPVIGKLRKYDPEFTTMPYEGDSATGEKVTEQEFQEDTYLSQCHREYNVMKYAALANVGFRFSDMTLEQLYVDATASEVSDMRSEQFVDDHLAAYPVSDELREYIQRQLLASVDQEVRKETSQAREFCQKYSAVLITGDPGSGKTCFVKSEILAYCKRVIQRDSSSEESIGDWHSSHVPVMISLSEMVAEKDLNESNLFSVVSRLLERRGFHFPAEVIQQYALQGRVAFFFDGLDEVVSIEKRAQVVKHINDLVSKYLPTGNRFVVTSRPAAVQVVNLLPSLHKLELLGLSETEIRKLARRLLALELATTQGEVHIGEGSISDTDNVVISQLINDCNKNPGVSRMAQNPLLLTLLIMIYANSGAPSAKRHRIYEEAIKTLASVRSREAGHQPISVQDLRERLGAIALSVYRKESGLLPFRTEVCEVVRGVMERQRGEIVTPAEANDFIQRVAESTGLIALEARKGERGRDIVTFMHHSFLEYFAAIGLSRELESMDIGPFVREPRWREILTLLAGIIGENEDISPIIKRFLVSGASEIDVDAKLLLFAIDCALECEVPSESSQRLLSKTIKECLSHGSGRLDPWVRSEIGQRLEYLLKVCGGSEFDNMISGLIRSDDENISAAAIDFAGHVCCSSYESPEIFSAIEDTCSRNEDAVLGAICAAAGRARSLRTASTQRVIISCLKGSRRSQWAAYEALASVPSLASDCWGEIINGIDDSNQRTSKLASIAAMHAGLNVDVISLTGVRKDLIIRALDNIDMLGGRDDIRFPSMKKDTIDNLLESTYQKDKMLGIRLLPLVYGEEHYIYDYLIDFVRGDSSREDLVAALVAFRWSGNVLALITIQDLRTISDWLNKGTVDVRVAAAQLLGCFGKASVAVEALLAAEFDELGTEDYCARITALSRTQTMIDRVKELYFRELLSYLDEKKKMGPDNMQRTSTLLDAARRLGETAPISLVNKVRGLIEDYRVNEKLKKKALLCYPAIAMPSRNTVDNIAALCRRPPIGLDVDLVQVPSIFATKCRRSVDYVVASVGALSTLHNVLLDLYAKHSRRSRSYDTEFCITELREGINDIKQIIVAFRDFIGDKVPLGEGIESKNSEITGSAPDMSRITDQPQTRDTA